MHIRHVLAGEPQYENPVADFMDVLAVQQEEAPVMAGGTCFGVGNSNVPSAMSNGSSPTLPNL